MSRSRTLARRARTTALVLVAAVACAAPRDPPALRPWQAALAPYPEHRLRDATPYVLPWRGQVIEFLCRFEPAAPISVALPPDATPHEARALEAALRAWEAAGVGVRFEPAPPERAAIVFRFVAPEASLRAEGTGATRADCRVDAEAGAAAAGARIPARLAGAEIRIVRRESEEWDASDHAWFAGEVAGVALHELAHALGYQGHARFGGGILARDTRETTPIGRRVLAGEAALADETLAALYRLPSGLVLRRTAVSPARTGWIDRLARAAGDRAGPFVRVGDRDGRVFWRLADGTPVGVTLASLHRTLADPARLVLLPDPPLSHPAE